jgi:hypothetical protein
MKTPHVPLWVWRTLFNGIIPPPHALPCGVTVTAQTTRLEESCKKLLGLLFVCALYIFLPEQYYTVVQYDTPDQGTPAVLEESNDVRARGGGA